MAALYEPRGWRAGDARDVDDPSGVALGHLAQRGVGEPQRRGHEHVEMRLLLLHGVLQELPLQPEPGVVDQQVDRMDRVGQPVLDHLQLVPVDQVGDQHLAGHAVRRRELVGDGLEPSLVAGDQHHVVAAPGQPVGEHAPEPRGRAGHEGERADAGGGAGCRRHATSQAAYAPSGQGRSGMMGRDVHHTLAHSLAQM